MTDGAPESPWEPTGSGRSRNLGVTVGLCASAVVVAAVMVAVMVAGRDTHSVGFTSASAPPSLASPSPTASPLTSSSAATSAAAGSAVATPAIPSPSPSRQTTKPPARTKSAAPTAMPTPSPALTGSMWECLGIGVAAGPRPPDLAVTVSPASPHVGERFTITVEVINSLKDCTKRAEFNLLTPANVTLVSVPAICRVGSVSTEFMGPLFDGVSCFDPPALEPLERRSYAFTEVASAPGDVQVEAVTWQNMLDHNSYTTPVSAHVTVLPAGATASASASVSASASANPGPSITPAPSVAATSASATPTPGATPS